MTGLSDKLATLALAGAIVTGAANASENRFADVVAAGWPQIEAVIQNTAMNVHALAWENAPILLAQVSQETNGKIYTVYLIQVDGTKKEVRYTKDTTGIINPPESGEDGKLLDGSPATSNPKLNRAKIEVFWRSMIKIHRY